MTDEVRFNTVHVPAGSSTGGQFGTKSSGHKAAKSTAAKPATPKKTTSTAHAASPWHNGVMAFDPHSNHGPGYDSPKGDPTVHQLQQALIRLGVTDDQGRKLADDGKLGPLTTQAIKEAQRRLGVNQDGQVTPTLLKQLVAAQSLPGKPRTPSHPSAPHAPAKLAPKAAAKTAPKSAPAAPEPPQHGLVKYRGDGMADEQRAAVQMVDANAPHYGMTDDECEQHLQNHLANLSDDEVQALGHAAEEMHGEGY